MEKASEVQRGFLSSRIIERALRTCYSEPLTSGVQLEVDQCLSVIAGLGFKSPTADLFLLADGLCE